MANVSPAFGDIIPSQKQQLLASNFLSFNGGAADGDSDTFAQQYLPEVYEQEVERYGNRTLSGFLRMVGAEMPMSSDQVIWSEQNRLHIAYTDVTSNAAGTTLTINIATPGVVNVVSVNDTIVVMDPATGAELKCLVTATGAQAAVPTGLLTVAPYTQADLVGGGVGEVALANLTNLKIFVYGSEYAKGTGAGGVNGYDPVSVTPQFTQYSNTPVIIRDRFQINASDMAQIGWVEVATEEIGRAHV